MRTCASAALEGEATGSGLTVTKRAPHMFLFGKFTCALGLCQALIAIKHGSNMRCGCGQISESQKHVGENHAVSGLKFKIIRRFMELGYAVLLSDVDIVTLQNPFKFLVRDSDVEAMSDGWDNATAYGELGVAIASCHCMQSHGVSWCIMPHCIVDEEMRVSPAVETPAALSSGLLRR